MGATLPLRACSLVPLARQPLVSFARGARIFLSSQKVRACAPVAITSILLRVRTLSSPRSNLLNTFSRGDHASAIPPHGDATYENLRNPLSRGDHFFRARTENVAAERHARRARRASIATTPLDLRCNASAIPHRVRRLRRVQLPRRRRARRVRVLARRAGRA